jgi:8-oxo-dGTP pyrophosphatase MutT (NUDIX family)
MQVARANQRFSLLSTKQRILLMLSMMILLVVVCAVTMWNNLASLSWSSSSAILPEKDQRYRGTQYWKEGVTQGVETIYETPFARFQIHKVLIGSKLINDWMWFDESDNINVLIETKDGTFIVLQQTKYAIEGSTYAVVGGLIEAGEFPVDAAKRELQEELGMVAEEWMDLGAYRAAANRGGGMTYTFLARKAAPYSGSKKSHGNAGIADGELERQDIVRLTRSQLIESVLAGKFKEIKWTATVALALLRTDGDAAMHG